jgi:hypothetical protein
MMIELTHGLALAQVAGSRPQNWTYLLPWFTVLPVYN